MVELSVALVLISLVAGFLIHRYLNILQVENDRKHEINTKSAQAEIQAAIDKALKSYDDRINKTWETISSTKQELESLKLQVGLRRVS